MIQASQPPKPGADKMFEPSDRLHQSPQPDQDPARSNFIWERPSLFRRRARLRAAYHARFVSFGSGRARRRGSERFPATFSVAARGPSVRQSMVRSPGFPGRALDAPALAPECGASVYGDDPNIAVRWLVTAPVATRNRFRVAGYPADKSCSVMAAGYMSVL